MRKGRDCTTPKYHPINPIPDPNDDDDEEEEEEKGIENASDADEIVIMMMSAPIYTISGNQNSVLRIGLANLR